MLTLIFTPGINQYDNVHIYNIAESVEMSFPEFKNLLGRAYSYINFNYPDHLLEIEYLNAQILSFYNDKKDLSVVARTYIQGKDENGRYIPCTEVNISNRVIKHSDLNNGVFSKNEHGIIIMTIEPRRKKKLHKEIDWDVEWWNTFLSCYHFYEKGVKSGISICFNKIYCDKYDVYTYFEY